MPFVHASILSEHAVPTATATSAPRITALPLVDAHWLLDNHARVRVIDTRRVVDHDAAHVPGACSFPLDALLIEDTSRPALARLARAAQIALATRGIGPDDHVVLIDDQDGSAALGAAVCELAGMRAVSAVAGGMDAWLAVGGQVGSDVHESVAVEDAWDGVQPRTTTVAAFEDLVDAVIESSALIVDARSQLEHEGIVGAPCCVGRGAIPGSVHLEWTAFFDMSGHIRPSEHIREIAAHVGLDPDQPIIVACHAGHRAAIAARVLRAAGFRDVRLSIGSWHEWSARGLGGDALSEA